MDSHIRQLSFYAAAVLFRLRRCLTGFRGARKIVRTQTKYPDPRLRDRSTPPLIALPCSLIDFAVRQFDAGFENLVHAD
jgi:hypothetical protein